MNDYEYIFGTLANRLEYAATHGEKILKEEYPQHKKAFDELNDILDLDWFNDFLNNKTNTPITVEQIKVILRFMNLQNQIEYDLKVIFYIYGLRDGLTTSRIFEQL